MTAPPDDIAATLDALLNPQQPEHDEPPEHCDDSLEAALRLKLGIQPNSTTTHEGDLA